MRLQDDDEDIMVQGYEYEPTSEKNKREVDDSDDILSNDDSMSDEDQPVKKITDMSLGTKMIGIVVFLIVVVLLIFGTISINKNKDKKRGEDLVADLEQEEDEFKYTSDEIKELRLNGFTGDEIERLQKDEVPAVRSIEEATEERKEKFEKEMKPFKDNTSDEYKALISNTWLGGADIKFDVSKSDTEWYTKTKTVNVDYKKIPAKGIQCFIRLTIKEATDTTQPVYAFMMVDPVRYSNLSETGNIVVTMEYVVTDGGTVVTSVYEKNVSDD